MEPTTPKLLTTSGSPAFYTAAGVFTNGATGEIKAGIYRSQRLDKETVTVRGIGWRNFALKRLCRSAGNPGLAIP